MIVTARQARVAIKTAPAQLRRADAAMQLRCKYGNSIKFWLDVNSEPYVAGDTLHYISDRSGNGMYLTQSVLSKRPRIAYTSGIKGIQFDGVDDDIVTAAALNFVAFSGETIAIICEHTNAAVNASIVHHGTTTGSFSRLWIKNDAFGPTRTTYDSTISASSYTFYNVAPSPSGGWMHRATVMDTTAASLNTSIKTYYSASVIANYSTSTVGSLPTPLPEGKLYVGSLAGSGQYFTKSISQVAIFNRALTVAEISETYELLSRRAGTR